MADDETEKKRRLLVMLVTLVAGFGMLNLLAYNGFAHNPVEYAESLRCPSLFMHGGSDSRATAAQSRRVFAAVPGPKEFIEFEHVGHESYVTKYPDEWKAAVARVLARAGIRRTVSPTE